MNIHKHIYVFHCIYKSLNIKKHASRWVWILIAWIMTPRHAPSPSSPHDLNFSEMRFGHKYSAHLSQQLLVVFVVGKNPDPNRKWFGDRGDVKLKLLLLVISGNYSITNFLIWHVRILYDKQYWKSHRIPRKISTRKWLSSDIPSNPYIFHVLSLNFTTKGEVQWKICWNQPYDTRIIDVAAATPKK